MMNPDISVIIPLYNTQKYIADALSSVLGQGKKNIEIIVVDDGSTDESVKIVRAYQEKHNFIELYRQKNAGPASARNYGMKKAKGTYLMFMDSDDLLPPDALEKLYTSASKNSADITMGMIVSFSGTRQWIPRRMHFFIDLDQCGTSLGGFPELINNVSPCNKLYRRNFVVENALHFLEGAQLSEDLYFVVTAFLKTSNVNIVPDTVYYYRGRETGEDALTKRISSKVFKDIVTVSDLLDRRQASSDYGDDLQSYHYRYENETRSIVYRLWEYVQANEDVSETLELLSKYLNKIGNEVIMLLRPMESLVLYRLKQEEYGVAIMLIRAQKKKGRTLISKIKDKAVVKMKDIFWSSVCLVLPFVKIIGKVPKNLWLIGEQQGNNASDTGWQFFLFCRKYFPERAIYFVTKKQNITDEIQKNMGHIIEYGSLQNFLFAINAEAFIFSDGYKDIFPHWQRIKDISRLRTSVFLQHGIFAFKRSEYYLLEAVEARQERFDIVVVSSEKERSYVSKDFGYPENIIAITGLSRFDRLYRDRNHRTKNKILFVPTWRTDLRYADDEVYLESMFHIKLLALVNNSLLHEVLNVNDYILQVCFHHAASRFTKHYSSSGKSVIFSDMDKVDLYDELISSRMLITDYSSVAFNMAYIERPTVFYQFDAEEFLVVEGGAFIDYDTELFGFVSSDPVEIIEEIKYNIDNDFNVRPEYQKKADTFFAFKDDHNSKRIFKEIELKLGGNG
jgi:glycosyltransferase involved in cell wall biosynthesis